MRKRLKSKKIKELVAKTERACWSMKASMKDNLTLEIITLDRPRMSGRNPPRSENILKRIFEGIEGISLNRPNKTNMAKFGIITKKGIPDYFYIKNNEPIFVEFKKTSDGLRFHQLKWILKSRYRVRIIFIEVYYKESWVFE